MLTLFLWARPLWNTTKYNIFQEITMELLFSSFFLINHSIGNDTNIGATEGMNTKIDGQLWTKSNAYNKVDISKIVRCQKKIVYGNFEVH